MGERRRRRKKRHKYLVAMDIRGQKIDIGGTL